MADEHLFARWRRDDEFAGIYQDVLLTRASDDMVHKMGQAGGLVSELLIWALEHGYIDAALTSYVGGSGEDGWKARPGGRHHGRGARICRVSLHLLGQNAGLRRGDRAGLLHARIGRHTLPMRVAPDLAAP